ncbi:signal transduction histidine kinase [Herbihabitans rhizosphaerae]|uniref:histidine kinase n=1 Tax=Herbihabitans rhizosphaerae TaxID=1872711 RepID=A0A4Q7KWF8_9PSEU|nr:HAMP domain-containing sensor histidine kinase [Herbihabitans rhizosphaerae]RZS40916.1 signal transduction histidine kinase [Herbihabitans rhizosphaerae]
MTTPLRTHSLRTRLTLATIVVAGLALLGVVVVVDAVYGLQARKQLSERLTDRANFAVQLDGRNQAAAQIVRRTSGTGIQVKVVTADGRRFGVDDPIETGEVMTTDRRLPKSGATISLYADTTTIDESRTLLRQVLGLVGGGALALTAGGLLLTVRRSLRPLDAMTNLAYSIAHGRRGQRLRPERTDTELGRTASALDTMIDSLEGAERQARDSEQRSRQFLADIAHELRTPIAGVQAAAQAAIQAPASRQEQDRMHLLLVREAKRAGRLVEDLLALAKIDAGLDLHREPVDLLALADAEADRARLLSPDLVIEVTGEHLHAVADAERLTQVVANVLDNARRHTPDGGRVSITVRRAPGQAFVEVADTGPGVPPSAREAIFGRLVRHDTGRDRKSGGSGLGLAIARGIARAHGGDLVCVEPPPGAHGAVFRLVLPAR